MAKPTLNSLKSPTVYRRHGIERDHRLLVRGESARQSIGKVEPGCEIFGFTKGQFSFIDVLGHLLDQTGPADLTISTWTASSADIQSAYWLMESGLIRSLRFIIDFSFKTRKPEFCADLIEAFGTDAIRVTVTHAKFALLTNENWNLVVRTSMNLNHNPRFENFEISDSAPFAAFMTEVVDEIWSNQDASEGFDARPYDNKKQFNGIFEANRGAGDGLVSMADLI